MEENELNDISSGLQDNVHTGRQALTLLIVCSYVGVDVARRGTIETMRAETMS